MKNKIKWFLKRILIVSNYPKQTIFSITNKDKMSLFHTAYENKKLMNTENSKIKEPRLEKLKDLEFDKLTNQSKKNSAHLNDSINKDYFSNLNNYGYGVKLLKISNFQEFNYLKKFHLYPANVFVLNEIKTLLDRSEIGEGLIIDYPSGIGNLLIYLEKFYDKNKLYGIDNFEQISKNDVKKYQQEMDNNFEIDTFEVFKQRNLNKKVDVVVCIELGLESIIQNIIELNPKFLIIETMYVSRHKKIKEVVKEKFDLYLINQSIVIYKKSKFLNLLS